MAELPLGSMLWGDQTSAAVCTLLFLGQCFCLKWCTPFSLCMTSLCTWFSCFAIWLAWTPVSWRCSETAWAFALSRCFLQRRVPGTGGTSSWLIQFICTSLALENLGVTFPLLYPPLLLPAPFVLFIAVKCFIKKKKKKNYSVKWRQLRKPACLSVAGQESETLRRYCYVYC